MGNPVTKEYLKESDKMDPIYNDLVAWAQMNDVPLSEVDFWYLTFDSYVHDVLQRRIEDGDKHERLYIGKMLEGLYDILKRKYC